MLPDEQDHAPVKDTKFHLARLLGVIFVVCVVLALVAFAVDWIVIGPLEGRVL